MVQTKGINETMKNWDASMSRIPDAYTKGTGRVQDFKGKAIAGQTNYVEAMSDATVLARREEKLQAMPDNAYAEGAKNKGAKNIVPGMKQGRAKMNTGMMKNLATIEATSIAPRSRDWNANIDNRLKPLAEALHKQKTGGA